MNWLKLTKKSLKSLKDNDVYFMVYSPMRSTSWYFDIIHWLDLDDLGYVGEEAEHHWSSLAHDCPRSATGSCGEGVCCYTYDDTELLHIFSHYVIVTKPAEKL